MNSQSSSVPNVSGPPAMPAVPVVQTIKGSLPRPPLAVALDARPTVWSLLKALRKRMQIALLVGLLVAMAVATATWLIVPAAKHTVSSKVWLKETTDSLLFPPKKEPSFAIYQKTQVALIKSRHVLTTALDYPGVGKVSFVREAADPITDLEKRIQVDFKDSAEILRIGLEGDNPEELKVVVDAVTNAYFYHFKKEEEKLREQKLSELQKLKKEYAQRLTAKKTELYQLAKGVKAPDLGILAVNQQVAMMLLTLAEKEMVQLQHQKLKLTSDLALEERKYFKDYAIPLQACFPSGLPTNLMLSALLHKEAVDIPPTKPTVAPAGPAIQKDQLLAGYFKDKIDIEETIRKDLPQAFSPKVAKEKANELEAKLAAVVKKIAERQSELGQKFDDPNPTQFVSQLDYLRDQLFRLTQFEHTLSGEIKQQAKLRDDLAQAYLDMEMIRKDVDRQDKMYENVCGLIEALEVERTAPPRLVPHQRATIYPPPVIGRREMGTAFGGAGSLLLILLAFAWLEFRSHRIGSREEVVKMLGINFIGAVPDISGRPWFGMSAKAELMRDRMLMDSVDAARTVLLSAARDNSLQVVMVTSAWMGEGKTATACHLAASLARAGRKTLLIDCDLRNPKVHQLFGVAQEPGLCEALLGECEITDAIRPPVAAGLSIIPAGSSRDRTIHALTEKGVAETVLQLRSQFDFIILDSSPVLIAPEAQLFSQYSDGVIISMMRNVSQLPKVHSACETLGRLRAHTLGFILNGVSDEMKTTSAYHSLSIDMPHAN